MFIRKSRILCLLTALILLLSVLPLVNNQMTVTGDISEYQQVINSLYELEDNFLIPETVDQMSNSQYDYNSLPITQNRPENEGYRVKQSITSEFFSQLVVTIENSHDTTYMHDQVTMLNEALTSEGAIVNIMDELFDIPPETNVLLVSSPNASYTPDELTMIVDWFYSEGPHLIWTAGDSDYGGYYSFFPNNQILWNLGSNFILSADAVDDEMYNYGASYKVAAQPTGQKGYLNLLFTEGVGSALFHGSTSVLGFEYGTGIVDLRQEGIDGVEVIMQSSEYATAIDLDESNSYFDYYNNTPETGSYPMMAIQDKGDSKYIIASGEVIYSDYQSQYSYGSETEGFHEGKQLVDNILSWFGYVVESYVPPSEPQLRVAFDRSHYPTYQHDTANLLELNLRPLNVDFQYLDNILDLSMSTDVLLIPTSTMEYTPEEMMHISSWFESTGKKLLWVSGDSDYDELFPTEPNNALLEFIGVNLRISADTVNDSVHNDGAPYRVAAQTPVKDGSLNFIFTDGVSSAMFHGPTTVLGYQSGSVVDLTEDSIPGVEVVMRTSSDTGIVNWDNSNSEFDYYFNNKPSGESYPMMAVDYHFGEEKYAIVSGEAIFSDYKKMYDLLTDQILYYGNSDTWTGGVQDGKILVDNVFNWMGLDPAIPRYYGHAPIYIDSEEQFLEQGFEGSGIEGDPYFLDGYQFGSYVEPLVEIWGTTSHFRISNSNLFTMSGEHGMSAISLFDTTNGIIEGNLLVLGDVAINLENSHHNSILGNTIRRTNRKGIMVASGSQYNTIESNIVAFCGEDGISVEFSDFNTIAFNELFSNSWAGVRLFGTSGHNDIVDNTIYDNWGGGIAFESYSDVYMPFYPAYILEIPTTATDADHISWHRTMFYADEVQAWYNYSNLETILTIDGERVDVWYCEPYLDEWTYPPAPWHIDVDYTSSPLPVGTHEFALQCILDGYTIYEKSAYVTVIPATEENYVSHNNIVGNEIFRNEWSGIDLRQTYGNLLMSNRIYQHYDNGIHIEDSANNIIDFNTIFENGAGISVNSADNNFLTNNDVFGNYWNGIQLSGTASHNTVSDNMIHNNWGAGVGLETCSDVFISYFPTFKLGIPVIASEADSIQMHVTWGFEEEDQAWNELDRTKAILTVNGEPVNVWYSGAFWDDWGIPDFPYPWHFRAYFNLDPLPAGVHDLAIQFYFDGEFVNEETTSITIILATDDEFTSHNYISTNDIYENDWCGIHVWNSISNIIDSNTISNNGEQGIWIGKSRSNEILNNIVEFSGADSGINLYHSYSHLLSGNTISYNMFGVLLEESNGNTLVENIICDNGGSGIQLMGTSSDNSIMGNTIHRNSLGIEINAYTEVQMRYWQFITATDVDFISWQASVVDPELGELQFWYNNLVTELRIDGELVEVEDSGIYYDEGWQQWRFDVNYHSEPLPEGEYEFQTKFILAGEELEEETRTPIVTVVPATDENYASHNVISNNDIFEFRWMGINLERSHYNNIEENTIDSSLYSTTQSGIRLNGAKFNTITKNKGSSCFYGGIMLVRSSDYNIVSYNEFTGPGWSGIFIGRSSFNEIKHNTLYENAMNGILCRFGNSNEFRRNYIFNNPIGIQLGNSVDSIVTRNFLMNNAEAGINLVDESSGNMISRNFVSGCGLAGISLLGSSNNNIHRNTVKECNLGILLESSTGNHVFRNIVFNNVEGILLSYSSGNKVSRNTVFKNDIGIHQVESSDNKIFRNWVFKNDINYLEEP